MYRALCTVKRIAVVFSLLIITHQNHAFGQSKCREIFEKPFQIQVADTHIEIASNVYHIRDLNGWFYFKAKLEDRQVNIKAYLINHNDRFRSTISGADAFAEMIAHFGKENVDIIQGRWFPFSVSNYQAFKEARNEGSTLEDAAFATWTGRQAKKHGYEYVEVSIELVDIKGFDPINNQASQNVVEYVKANFYKTKPSESRRNYRPRISRSLPMIE